MSVSIVEELVIAGQVGTVSTSEVSLDLYKRFGKSIRKRFSHVKAFWLGPEARRRWMKGARLTDNVQARWALQEDPDIFH